MISIIVPTYKEEKNLLELIGRIKKSLASINNDFEIIIVDDNSQDKTKEIIKNNFKNDKTVKLFIRKNKRELGSAILFGIKKSKGKIIIGMDADLNHLPEIIPDLIKEIDNYDLSIASRFVQGGGMENKARFLFSKIYSLSLKKILGFPINDNMSGFYAIKRNKLLALPINKIYYGYGEYHIRLVYLAKKNKLRIKEIPAFFPNRKFGKSKSNLLRMFFKYTYESIKLRLEK